MSDVRFPMAPLSTFTTAIKDGTHGTHRRVAEGVPLLSAKNITANGEIATDETDDLISEAEYLDLTRSFRLEPDDLLLTIVGSLGRRAVYSGQRITFQRSVAYVRPQQQKVLTRFLFHWMGHPAFSAELARRSNATAQAGLYLGELAKVSVPVPAVWEQGEITQVLDTLDTAIHETEAIIAKLKAVKQGLLHDLLTRGIDANGELRPPRGEAPHLYKESPLGWIPKEWSAPTLASVCSLIRDGTHLPPPRVKDGPLLLSVRNMQNGRLLLTDQDTRVSDTFYKQMHKHWEIQKGDVLLAIVGSIGKTAMVDDMPKFTLQRSVAVLRGKPDQFMNEFLHLSLGAPEFQVSLWAKVNQTAQPGIYLDQLGAIPIRAPLPPEQEAIQLRLQMAQCRIDDESDFLQKLRKQKAGLIDDLLTGRVRVTPLLEGATL
jgi:type I restriction enzyme S subunit